VVSLRNLNIFAGLGFATTLLAASASAQTCSTTQYPYPLQNGSVADAGQVTADLNCAPVYGLANWAGYVGIGTTTPSNKFQVLGRSWLDNLSGDVTGRAQGLTVSYSPPANYTNGVDPGDGLRNTSFIAAGTAARPVIISLRNVAASPFWDIVMDPNDGVSLKFSRAGYAPTISLRDDKVGIGTTAPGANLHVNGSAILSQGYSATSDARLKTGIQPIENALATVERLQGVRYRWKLAADRTVGKDLDLPVAEPQIGFLAQEVEKVVPEAVVAPKTGDEIYSLKEEKLIPLLVEAIKEQQQEIKALRAEVEKLKAK